MDCDVQDQGLCLLTLRLVSFSQVLIIINSIVNVLYLGYYFIFWLNKIEGNCNLIPSHVVPNKKIIGVKKYKSQ